MVRNQKNSETQTYPSTEPHLRLCLPGRRHQVAVARQPRAANADYANDGRGAKVPAAQAREGIEALVWAGDVFMHF